MTSIKRKTLMMALNCVTVFVMLSFAALSFSGEAFDPLGLLLAVATPVILWFTSMLLMRMFNGVDAPLLVAVEFLCALGLIMQYRLRPATAMRQLVVMGIGTAVMIVALTAVARTRSFKLFLWPIIIGTVGFLVVPVLFGKWTSGAKNWIEVAGVSVQPSEFGKVSLAFVCALVLAEKGPRKSRWPLLVFLFGCMALLMLQRDLGAIAIYASAAMLAYFAATSDWLVTAAGFVLTCIGAVVSYELFPHVQRRVMAWRNPWADIDDSGHQIVQGLMAIGSGGFFGLGLGNGAPRAIPAYYTDFVFAVVCEEMGLLIGLMTLMFYALIVARGVAVALKARDRFSALLALCASALLGVQTLIIIGGVIKLIPLTGVTLPFISYGGSSMLASFALVGVIQGVSIRSAAQDREDERRAAA